MAVMVPKTPKRKRYRIEVRGEIGALLSNEFSELSIETGQGKSVLTTPLVDRNELFTVLDRLPDFAIEVLGFREVPATQVNKAGG